MREKFINGFVTKLYGEIPDEYLSVIRNKLSLYANDFDIQLRETGMQNNKGKGDD